MRCLVGSFMFAAVFVVAILATAQDFQVPGNTATDKASIKDADCDGWEDAIIADSAWTHIAPWNRGWRYEDFKLLASDSAADNAYGYSVSISGDVALVGAKYDIDNGTESGSAYVFRYDPGTESWIEEEKLLASDGASYDYFGCSVSVSGDVALVGAYGNDDNGNKSGSAYVFRYDSGTESWIEKEKLLASDGAGTDYFGCSVSISGDVALVGAYGETDNGNDSGSSYVFRYDPGTESWIEEEKLLASDGATYDWFGWSVSISGDVALVGVWGDDDNGSLSGSAYAFRYDPGTESWTEEEKLLASDGAVDDWFAYSVSVSGDVALVGARYDDDNGEDSGSAYVFRYDPGTESWVEEKLLASDGAADDWFGYSVSISGDVALVGAWGDDDNGSMSGSAYQFRYDSGTESWIEEVKLLASDGAVYDWFGCSVSISDDAALVGAWGDDDNGSMFGSAYVFHLQSD